MLDESDTQFCVDVKAIAIPCGLQGQVILRFHDDPDEGFSRSNAYFVEGKLYGVDWEPKPNRNPFPTYRDILENLCTILSMPGSPTMDDVYEKLRQLVAEKF